MTEQDTTVFSGRKVWSTAEAARSDTNAPAIWARVRLGLAAPLISGMIALSGNAPSLGTAKYIYDHRAGLSDVIGGSNALFQDCGGDYLCTALKGYDGPTGLGTPVGVSAL